MAYEARVFITLKEGILDPEGQAVQRKLSASGIPGVVKVRTGRLVSLTVDAATSTEAKARVDELCRRVIVNPVTEAYEFELVETPGV